MRRLRFIAPLAAAAAIAVPAGTAAAHHGGGDQRGHGQGDHGHGHGHAYGRHHGNYRHGRGHTCGLDREYLRTAIEGDRFEIAGGNMALGKTSNAAVRTLAQTLVADHTQSLQQAIAIAQQLGVPVPPDPSPTEQWELDTISGLSGATFDKAYSTLEVADHQQDIDETSFEVQNGCSHVVRRDAAQELPTLQHHLQLAQQAVAAS